MDASLVRGPRSSATPAALNAEALSRYPPVPGLMSLAALPIANFVASDALLAVTCFIVVFS